MTRRRFNRSASHEPSRVTIVVTALGALVLLLGLTMIALVAPRGVPGIKYYKINAQFADAAQIADLSEVRIAGRHVGVVTNTALKNGHATVRLQLFPGEGPLRADSTARIRLKGLLGAKFVDVTPGQHGGELASGATLPVKQTSSAVELLDVLQALDAPTRSNLQTTVKGLGEGFLGRGEDLNRMLAYGPPYYLQVRQLGDAVLARKGAAARFAPSAETLASAYDPVRAELASGFAPESQALQPFVDRSTSLSDAITVAPSSLRSLQQGLDAATPLLNETARLARATTRITRQAPAALHQTRILLRDATPAVNASDPLLQRLSGAVSPTLAFLKRVDPVIAPTIRGLVSNLPVLRELAGRGCDVLDFGRNWRSTLGFGVPAGFGDPTGTLDKGIPGLGPMTSLRIVPVRTGSLEVLSADLPPVDDPSKGRNAYPAPCAATSERLK
jgi:virulence factor Mce-like protein